MAASKKQRKRKREVASKPKDGLTPMQRAFVEALLGMRRPSATKAAIKAGYSKKTAHSQGPRLLEHVGVAAELERRRNARLRKFHMGRDEILAQAAHVARGEVTDYVNWDVEGQTTWRPSKRLSEGERAAVKSFKRKKKTIPCGDGQIEEISLEVTLHDKMTALKLLGQEAGLFKDDKEATNVNVTVHSHLDALGDEEAEELARQALDRRSRGTVGADSPGSSGSPP